MKLKPGDLAFQRIGHVGTASDLSGDPRYNWLRRHANGSHDRHGKALGKWVSDQLVVLLITMSPEHEACLVVCGNDVGWLDVGRLKLDGTG